MNQMRKSAAYDSECYGCGMHLQNYPSKCPLCGSEQVHSLDIAPQHPGTRLFSDHPSGYRAEWKQSAPSRFHVYEGDTPVDSPGMPGFYPSQRSSEQEEMAKGITQHHLDSALHDWAEENGAGYMGFNHPDIERPSYKDRHGFEGSRRQAAFEGEFVTKRAGDVEPGDIVIRGGQYKEVTHVTHHEPGHNLPAVRNDIPAVQLHFDDGDTRSTGENYFHQCYHPIMKGEEARPFPLKENEGLAGYASMRTQAYGEIKAPIQVDTLRDANCPVCGDSDSYDGDQCQVCGFVTPPKMFQDPDLERARLLDLRANPATGDPNNTDPLVGDPNAPVDPSQIGPDGQPLSWGQQAAEVQADSDDDGIVEGEVQGLGDAGVDPNAPVDPSQVDEEGNPIVAPGVDPAAAEGRVLQGGEPFTPGPNAPAPAQPMEPGAAEAQVDEEGNPVAPDGQALAPQAAPDPAEPGFPDDGTPDLLCPACGFQADAASPLATSTDAQAPADAGDGMLAGDVCPNCGQAPLTSVGEVEQMQQVQPGPAGI